MDVDIIYLKALAISLLKILRYYNILCNATEKFVLGSSDGGSVCLQVWNEFVNSSEEEQERIISGRSLPDTILEEEEGGEDFHMVDGMQDDKTDKRKCKRKLRNYQKRNSEGTIL